MDVKFLGNYSTDYASASMGEVLAYINKLEVVGLDIETTGKYSGTKYKKEGLDPYMSDIIMIQVGDLNTQYVIDSRFIDCLELVKLLATKKCVGHNLKFEYVHLLHKYNVRLTDIFDTMVVEMILRSGNKNHKNPVTLQNLAKQYLKIKVDKDVRLEFLRIGNTKFKDRHIKYGALDIVYPLQIMNKQLKIVKANNYERTIRLESKFTLCLGDIEYIGMYFDKDKWVKVAEKAMDNYKAKKEELTEFTYNNYPSSRKMQTNLFGDKEINIDWGSSKQIISFLAPLGLCPKARSKDTGRMDYTVNKEEIKSFLTKDDLSNKDRKLLNTFVELQNLKQNTTTFGTQFLKYINPETGRVHSSFNQILKTGRISSTSPNLQNIPSDFDYRQCFNAPRGSKIVNADYSGQEQIVLVNKSKDAGLIEFYNSGNTDMHSFIASKIYKLPMEDIIKAKKSNSPTELDKKLLKYRQIAKAAGFAINYGGNGSTIAKNLGIPKSQGDEVYDKYFDAFPGLKNFFKFQKMKAIDSGKVLIDSLTNRVYEYPNAKNLWLDPSTRRAYESSISKKALNYPIQGTAGLITKTACILIRKELLEKDLYSKYQITNIVHDEINMESKEEYAEEAAQLLTKCMQKAGDIWCKVIPLKADAVIGDYWAH